MTLLQHQDLDPRWPTSPNCSLNAGFQEAQSAATQWLCGGLRGFCRCEEKVALGCGNFLEFARRYTYTCDSIVYIMCTLHIYALYVHTSLYNIYIFIHIYLSGAQKYVDDQLHIQNWWCPESSHVAASMEQVEEMLKNWCASVTVPSESAWNCVTSCLTGEIVWRFLDEIGRNFAKCRTVFFCKREVPV